MQFFLGKKKIENSSCLQLISLTKPIISTFTPSLVHRNLLLQRGGKRKAGTEAGKKSTSPNTYPKRESLWRLNSALHRGRDRAPPYTAHCLLADHQATCFLTDVS